LAAQSAGPVVAHGVAADSTRSGASVTQPPELLHFTLLSLEDQANAIRQLSAEGLSDFTIATATKLSVEMIRGILAGDCA
jgi:hypothetical protein